MGKLPAAVNYFQKALELDPHNPQINNSLANSLQRMGEFERAIDLYYKVIQLQPTNAEAHNNLGRALKLQGRVEEAIAYYQKAVELEPSNPVYHSNFLLALNYTCKLSPAQIFNHHQQWEQKHALKISRPLVYSNPPQPGKRLRIGYVSPDFHIHSVAYFMLPILQKHHPQIVEIFLYSDVTNPDSLTSQFQQLAHHWRNILGLTDLEVSELIQKDQIDILVDLTGHTGQNRLLVFAHKPAPIQITYLGYPATTGLSSIDYRLTDGYADPLGKTEAYHSEKLFRLNDCFLCYQALSEPPLSEPPCMRNGYLTFGSFNNLAKVTHQVVETWAAILQAVPQAKLMLKYRGLGEVKTQQLWLERFAQYNIKAERLLLTNRIPAHSEHLSAYNQIDIALDPFPYNGTTTTFEALWMGVPVIVLAGSSHVGRVGVSILSNLGLVDWIATSRDGYIQ